MHALIEIQSAAMDQTDHFRCSGVVGARSGLYSGESRRSPMDGAKSGGTSYGSDLEVVIPWRARLALASAASAARTQAAQAASREGGTPSPRERTRAYQSCAHAPRLMNRPSPGRPLYSLFSTITL